MKRLQLILAAAIIVIFALLGTTYIVNDQHKIQSKEAQLKALQIKYNQLNDKLKKAPTPEQLKALEAEKAQLEQQKRDLEGQLQAKRNAANSAVAVATGSTPVGATTFKPTGNKQTWLEASGIPADLWWAVDYIVTRESGWKPCAYNPGLDDCSAWPINACGLVQQNPCHKIPGDWRDPVAALKWQYGYVNDVYGGYVGAVEYWKIHGNY